MKKQLKLLAVSTFTSLALLIGLASPALAVDSKKGTGQALEISPPLISLSADPGDTITTKILIRDISAIDLVISNEVNDFESDGETGAPKILLKDDAKSPYSLKGWITPIASKQLKPKQIEEVPVTINVPASASPGSYFAVVRFTGTAAEQQGSGVGLTSSVGALVFVRVSGKANEKLDVTDFYTAKDGKKTGLFESTPSDLVIKIKNSGNVIQEPTGRALVTDTFGNEIAGLNVNLAKNIVLPGSTRQFTTTLDSRAIGKNRILFGYYTAKLTLSYGDNKKIEDTVSFWIIPYKLILLLIVVLVALIAGFRIWILRYKKRVIRQARRRR